MNKMNRFRLIIDIPKLHNILQKREITYKDIMKDYHCSKDMIIALMNEYKLTPPRFSVGRRRKLPTQALTQKIIKYAMQFGVGYQRCCQALKLHGFEITEWDTRFAYEVNGLYRFEKEYTPKKSHDSKFIAEYTGQLWHTDLHYLHKQNDSDENLYLIAFIDDRTRYLVHAEILSSKSSIFTANALREALKKEPKPYMITIDNGTEFIGEQFQNVLTEFNIQCHRTHPYTPEENGKIERWWKTFDQAVFHRNSIDVIVNEYNYFWPHRSLQELTHCQMTPAQAWILMDHWENKDTHLIIYSN